MNGKFSAWIEADIFTSEDAAREAAKDIRGIEGTNWRIVPFTDLPEDDLDSVIDGAKDTAKIAEAPAPSMFIENCPKCGGSGIYSRGRFSGQCFTCKGEGKLSFKTSKEERSGKRAQSKSSAIKKADANLQAFKIAEPEVFAWFDGSTFPFAVAMREAVSKYGYLTERQLSASKSAAGKLEAAKAASAARVTDAKAIDTAKIEAAFATAGSSLKAPKLRVAGMVISHAKATSANAGALYVKADGLYLGKIMGGKFVRSRDCGDDQEASLLDIANDPKEAAIKYGRVTGCCACCGRPLENAESIARGIGPICAGKWGF
jgi:hypothetical protein